MNNYIKTIISGLKQWVSTQITKSKSDWNQSDSSATNYVKNRTHYTDIGEVEVLSKTTYNDRTGIALNTPLITGNTYTVTFNGTVYECIAKRYDDYIMIGNNALYEYDNGDETDTGEPFAIECAINNTSTYVYFSDTITSSPTLRITTMGEVVHKLDKKYLPDMVTSYNDLEDKPTIYTDVIRYDTTQSLSSAQMAKARSNIGAANSSDVTGVLRYTAAQSLTSAQKTQVKSNIGIGSFDGTYYSLTGKPTVYEDVVRYGSQSLSTDQKKQARENIGASNFSGRYSDLTDAPEYAQGYDRLYVTAVHTEGIDIYEDKDGDLTTTPFASWSPTTWHCNPNGQDGSKTSSTTFGFGTRDDDVILQAQYMKSNGTTITSKDIQFTGIATPTADNDVANKAYVDGLVGDTAVSEQISEATQGFVVDLSTSGKYLTYTFANGGSGSIGMIGKAGSSTDSEIFNDYTTNSAVGKYSHVEGYKNATGNYAAHAEGGETKANGQYSHSEGYGTTADEDCSHAEGSVTVASGNASHAEGQGSVASGQCAHAEGYNATAIGNSSHAEGRGSNDVPTDITISTSNDVIIDAWETTKFNLAKDDQCHTEGNNTLALDSCDHAEGYQTIASGGYSHSEGYQTKALRIATHAEGYNTTANGAYSHVEGVGTLASGANQHVQGKYNIEDAASDYAHIVGNGTSSARSNAHTLDWDGNAWFAGDIRVGGTSYDDAISLLPKSTTITLPAANWTGASNPWSQVVTINGVTSNSKVDLQPTAVQIVEMQNNDIALMAENNDGVITVYAIGSKPTVDYTMQVLITEVIPV